MREISPLLCFTFDHKCYANSFFFKRLFNLICAAKINEMTFVGRRFLKNTRSFLNRKNDG